MPPEFADRDAALVVDIILAAEDALEFVSGLDEAGFSASRLHQNAVIRSLEIIGEAAGKLSEAFRSQLPTIPWRQLTSMRHRLIHGYATVRVDLVWRVLSDQLPVLLSTLKPFQME